MVEGSGASSSRELRIQMVMLWRGIGFLSVRLQRQNFLGMAVCAPSLDARVAGVLG